MKVIIGLGNPGKDYVFNRHNVGYMFVDTLTETPEIKIFKTQGVFMNESGRFVAEKVKFFKLQPSDLIVVHDDLDIRFGDFKINLGKGPQIHNGLLSIEEALGTDQFWRVRIGIDSRVRGEGKLGDSGHDFVLNDFSKAELEKLQEVFGKIGEEIKKIV